MKSPFPGMDPYLEPHWRDVYSSLVIEARNALNERLPEDLIARAEERVAVESDSWGGVDHLSPDVRVLEAVQSRGTVASAETGVAALAPYRLVALVEPITERFIEIVEATGERLVTVIEFLSPTNKSGRGLRDFREKRDKLLAGGVNFVEVDLVLAGDWLALLHPHRSPTGVRAAYRATVRAVTDPVAVHFHAIPLCEPLPSIKIPLRHDDQPIELHLQSLLDRAYSSGRYARTLDYTRPPPAGLDIDDQAWIDALLRGAGKRPG